MDEKEASQKSFIIYCDNQVVVYRLQDEEAGKLFKSLFPYVQRQIKPDFEDSPALAMAFDILCMAIDRDKEKYKKRCEKNRDNIAKRWSKKNTVVYNRINENTKHSDNDIDSGIDNDIDIDSGIDSNNKEAYQLITDAYNNTCLSFPRLIKLSDKRKKAIRARMRTYDLEDFKTLFEKAESSDFLKGRNDKNWSANFDWLIADGNMCKVLEGYYDSRKERGVVNGTKGNFEEAADSYSIPTWD